MKTKSSNGLGEFKNFHAVYSSIYELAFIAHYDIPEIRDNSAGSVALL